MLVHATQDSTEREREREKETITLYARARAHTHTHTHTHTRTHADLKRLTEDGRKKSAACERKARWKPLDDFFNDNTDLHNLIRKRPILPYLTGSFHPSMIEECLRLVSAVPSEAPSGYGNSMLRHLLPWGGEQV